MAEKEILKKVGKAIKIEPVAKKFLLNSFDLVERATDKEIEAALGKKHLFDIAEVYAIIGSLISKQPKGKDGSLITTGYSNLFYTSSCVVVVGWRGSRWSVSTWNRLDLWYSGRRVFSPATSA